MDDIWDEILDKLDWDAIDRDVKKSLEEDAAREAVRDYFAGDEYDYKRGYIRKLRRTHPEITDPEVIAVATEQMLESHEGGVELDVDDALRFAERKKLPTTKELVKMLTDAGINDSNIDDVLDKMLSPDFEDDGKRGSIKNPKAKKKANDIIRYAYVLARNKDVLILELPTFDPQADWVQAKLAFFSEDLSNGDKYILDLLMKSADNSRLVDDSGVAVAVFQVYNAWSDFK